MKSTIFLILLFFSNFTFSGNLYTFDKNLVLMTSLSHIHLRYKELANIELTPDAINPYINTKGKLVVDVFFSYKAKTELGLLYVCSKLDENGDLLNIRRDIGARKVMNLMIAPDTSGC
jgi:hypothetical protein